MIHRDSLGNELHPPYNMHGDNVVFIYPNQRRLAYGIVTSLADDHAVIQHEPLDDGSSESCVPYAELTLDYRWYDYAPDVVINIDPCFPRE